MNIIESNGGGIYALVNRSNGKLYVGQASNLAKRMYQHMWSLQNGKHINDHLQSAWLTHGAEAFDAVVLQQCDETDNPMEWEQMFIDAYQSADRAFGYNACPAVGSTLGLRGYKHTDAWKAKRSALMMGHTVSEEFRAKLRGNTRAKGSAAWVGRKHTAESKAKISAAKTGAVYSAETIAKRAASNTGRVRSDEAKARMSAAQKGKTISVEARAKMSAAKEGKIATPESRAKMSASTKDWWARKREEQLTAQLTLL